MKHLKHKAYKAAIQEVTEDAQNVYAEGWANFSTPDEVNERLDAESLDDSRYIDNSIVLFNHDTNFPIGKCVEWSRKPEGLWVKCALSKSEDTQIGRVRDLIQEGIIKSFSVGFSGGEAGPDPLFPGSLLIKNWKMHELSIVTIPMQAQSTFSVSVSKAFDSKFKKCKSLSEARIMTLQMKGAQVAALIAPKLEVMDDVIRNAAFAKVSEIAAIPPEAVQQIVTGDNVTITPEAISALADVFGVDAQALTSAAAEDSAGTEAGNPSTDVPSAPPAEKAPPEMPAEPAAPPATDAPVEFGQVAASIKDCVVGKVPALIKDGMSKQEALTMAISQCSSEKGCAPSELSDDDWGNFINLEFAESVETKSTSKPLQTKQTVIETGDNIHVQLMQQTVQMLGSIAVKMDQIIAAMSAMGNEVRPGAEPVTAPAVVSLSTNSDELEIKNLFAEAHELGLRLKSLTI